MLRTLQTSLIKSRNAMTHLWLEKIAFRPRSCREKPLVRSSVEDNSGRHCSDHSWSRAHPIFITEFLRASHQVAVELGIAAITLTRIFGCGTSHYHLLSNAAAVTVLCCRAFEYGGAVVGSIDNYRSATGSAKFSLSSIWSRIFLLRWRLLLIGDMAVIEFISGSDSTSMISTLYCVVFTCLTWPGVRGADYLTSLSSLLLSSSAEKIDRFSALQSACRDRRLRFNLLRWYMTFLPSNKPDSNKWTRYLPVIHDCRLFHL